MYGLISQKGFRHVMRADLDTGLEIGSDYGYGGGSYVDLGGGPPAPVSVPIAVANAPAPAPAPAQLVQYDLSPITNLRPGDKWGSNLVSDIRSSYDTYMSGSPVGRGGQYAADAARRYGVNIQEAARGYLQGAGLLPVQAPAPAPAVAEPVWTGPNPIEEHPFFGNDPPPPLDPEPAPDSSGVVTQPELTGPGNPFDTIASVFERAFAIQADEPARPVVVVGDATQKQMAKSGGGGAGSLGLIMILIAGAGFAVYWFYIRKRGNDGGAG